MTAGKKTLLIVDDDKFLLDMYSVKFREAGFEVALSPSAAEALEKIHGGLSPDVILLDVVMPEMNGIELLKRLREEEGGRHASIIMLSNQGQQSDIDEAKKFGVDGYIIKANSIPSEVLDKVNDVIAHKGNG